MSKWMKACLIIVAIVALAGVVHAEGENSTGEGAVVKQTNDSVILYFSADALDFAAAIKAETTGTYISVEVADCCLYGDVWRGIIWKGKKLATSSNQTEAGAAFPVYPGEGCWSPPATVNKRRAVIFLTAANVVPGGLPAGMYARISSDGALTYEIKSVVGGSGPI